MQEHHRPSCWVKVWSYVERMIKLFSFHNILFLKYNDELLSLFHVTYDKSIAVKLLQDTEVFDLEWLGNEATIKHTSMYMSYMGMTLKKMGNCRLQLSYYKWKGEERWNIYHEAIKENQIEFTKKGSWMIVFWWCLKYSNQWWNIMCDMSMWNGESIYCPCFPETSPNSNNCWLVVSIIYFVFKIVFSYKFCKCLLLSVIYPLKT